MLRTYCKNSGTIQHDLKDYKLFTSNKEFYQYYGWKNKDYHYVDRIYPQLNEEKRKILIKVQQSLKYTNSKEIYELARIEYDIKTTYWHVYKYLRNV